MRKNNQNFVYNYVNESEHVIELDVPNNIHSFHFISFFEALYLDAIERKLTYFKFD